MAPTAAVVTGSVAPGGAALGVGAYNVGVSQTVASGYLTAPTAPNTQVFQTDSQAGAVERMLTYRPGGDLLQDNHVGGTLFGYDYNAAKRLVEVTQNGTAEGEYGYDFQGQRVLRWILGSAYTAYIHDEQGHLLAEHNGHTGAVSVEYTWIDDLPVEQESGGATWFVHTGQIGEVQMVTNGSGSAALWSAYVDPYGTATNIGTPSITMNMRLPGQYYQAETNSLSQNGWRDYDPSLGRYVEGDPRGIDAGQNVYAYVDGDPLNDTDPWGLGPQMEGKEGDPYENLPDNICDLWPAYCVASMQYCALARCRNRNCRGEVWYTVTGAWMPGPGPSPGEMKRDFSNCICLRWEFKHGD
jgi:RHS repeat-associated protein